MKYLNVRTPEKAVRQLKKLAKKRDTTMGRLAAALIDREYHQDQKPPSKMESQAGIIDTRQLNLPLI